MYRLGIIGCGSRMSGLLPHFRHEGLTIAAVADPRVGDMQEKFGAASVVCSSDSTEHDSQLVALYPDAESMLASERLDGICIGTRCSLHTPMALLAGRCGIPIFLEKPVSTSWEQLEALSELLPSSESIVVSFPLRRSAIAETVKQIVDSGELGEIEHIQAWNNVFYGRGYYKKWYRDDNETGGLFLQKSTHDFDYISYLLGDRKPVRLCAVESKQIYKGDMPAGQRCADCTRQRECPESPKNLERAGELPNGEYCCFALDTGNQDSGSVIIEYDTGMHIVYSQNFFVRKGAGSRGARLMGYRGTLEFDFNTNRIEVWKHFEDKHYTIDVGSGGGHSGGDARLCENFAGVVRGEEKSLTTLADGIASARLCLAARDSAREHRFVEV